MFVQNQHLECRDDVEPGIDIDDIQKQKLSVILENGHDHFVRASDLINQYYKQSLVSDCVEHAIDTNAISFGYMATEVVMVCRDYSDMVVESDEKGGVENGYAVPDFRTRLGPLPLNFNAVNEKETLIEFLRQHERGVAMMILRAAAHTDVLECLKSKKDDILLDPEKAGAIRVEKIIEECEEPLRELENLEQSLFNETPRTQVKPTKHTPEA